MNGRATWAAGMIATSLAIAPLEGFADEPAPPAIADQAATTPAPPASAPPASAPPASAPPELAPAPGSAAPPAQEPAPAPAPEAPRPAPVPYPAPPPPAGAWRWLLGAQGSAAFMEEVPIGAVANVEVRRRLPGPAVRFSLALQQSTIEGAVASGRFRWGHLGAEICPLRLTAAQETLELTPCGGIAFGFLDAKEKGVPDRRRHVHGWIAPRAVLRGAVWIISRLAFEAQGGVEVPLLREQYTFRDGVDFRAPAAYAIVSFGFSFALDGPDVP